jgi:alanyl-tRNA synthetase
MRLLGVSGLTFPELFQASRDAMKSSYPEVDTDYARIAQIAYGEEEAFVKTLEQGTTILDLAVGETKQKGDKRLPGATAFLLHDTFGFPIDLTLEMAEEAGLSVDRVAFDKLMTEQRTRAKSDAKSKKSAIADMSVYAEFRAHGETVFTGYQDLMTETRILGLLKEGKPVTSASAGDILEVIVAETSLYAESGGQDSDSGRIIGGSFELDVIDVQKPIKGLVSHTVTVMTGTVAVDDKATTVVDRAYRRAAAQAHSATHLIHAALRQTLGDTAHQSGSYNKAGYLRLDFSWNEALSNATRTDLEQIVRGAIDDDFDVVTREIALDEAKKLGAMALFGEKYGDVVRMVDIGGPWSRELCAGTHVTRSSQVGGVSVVSEASVGSSNRRIEALVGADALASFAVERAIVNELTSNFKVPREDVVERMNELATNLKSAQKRIAEFESATLKELVPGLLAGVQTVGAVDMISAEINVSTVDALRDLATAVREKIQNRNAVISLGAIIDDKPSVIVLTTAEARLAGHKAGVLVKSAAAVLGGGGGGRDDMAQAGGSDATRLADALAAVTSAVAGS